MVIALCWQITQWIRRQGITRMWQNWQMFIWSHCDASIGVCHDVSGFICCYPIAMFDTHHRICFRLLRGIQGNWTGRCLPLEPVFQSNIFQPSNSDWQPRRVIHHGGHRRDSQRSGLSQVCSFLFGRFSLLHRAFVLCFLPDNPSKAHNATWNLPHKSPTFRREKHGLTQGDPISPVHIIAFSTFTVVQLGGSVLEILIYVTMTFNMTEYNPSASQDYSQ